MDYADATAFIEWFLSEEGNFVADGDLSPKGELVRLQQPIDWTAQDLAPFIVLYNVKWSSSLKWYKAGDKLRIYDRDCPLISFHYPAIRGGLLCICHLAYYVNYHDEAFNQLPWPSDYLSWARRVLNWIKRNGKQVDYMAHPQPGMSATAPFPRKVYFCKGALEWVKAGKPVRA
jgi:hypothetical protein